MKEPTKFRNEKGMTETLQDREDASRLKRLIIFGVVVVFMLALGVYAVITMNAQAEQNAISNPDGGGTTAPIVPDEEEPATPDDNVEEDKYGEGDYYITDEAERVAQAAIALNYVKQLCPNEMTDHASWRPFVDTIIADALFITPSAEYFLDRGFMTRECLTYEETLLLPSQLQPDKEGEYYVAFTVTYNERNSTAVSTPTERLNQIIFEFSENGISYLDVQ